MQLFRIMVAYWQFQLLIIASTTFSAVDVIFVTILADHISLMTISVDAFITI